MFPFRVVVTDGDRATSTTIVRLDRSPDVGETVRLPHGGQVVVRHVVTGRDGLAGVVVAAPA